MLLRRAARVDPVNAGEDTTAVAKRSAASSRAVNQGVGSPGRFVTERLNAMHSCTVPGVMTNTNPNVNPTMVAKKGSGVGKFFLKLG